MLDHVIPPSRYIPPEQQQKDLAASSFSSASSASSYVIPSSSTSASSYSTIVTPKFTEYAFAYKPHKQPQKEHSQQQQQNAIHLDSITSSSDLEAFAAVSSLADATAAAVTASSLLSPISSPHLSHLKGGGLDSSSSNLLLSSSSSSLLSSAASLNQQVVAPPSKRQQAEQHAKMLSAALLAGVRLPPSILEPFFNSCAALSLSSAPSSSNSTAASSAMESTAEAFSGSLSSRILSEDPFATPRQAFTLHNNASSPSKTQQSQQQQQSQSYRPRSGQPLVGTARSSKTHVPLSYAPSSSVRLFSPLSKTAALSHSSSSPTLRKGSRSDSLSGYSGLLFSFCSFSVLFDLWLFCVDAGGLSSLPPGPLASSASTASLQGESITPRLPLRSAGLSSSSSYISLPPPPPPAAAPGPITMLREQAKKLTAEEQIAEIVRLKKMLGIQSRIQAASAAVCR